MATFNLSRAASLYETGIGRGMGFRDSNQDLLGFVHMIPARARERLLDIAATQLSDGTCYHQYQPLTKKGNAEVGGDFYDDHLWLVLSTCAYIKETGDASILDEAVGYADGDLVTGPDGKRRHKDGRPAESLLHHLETSIAYTMGKRGPHGLPLIGHADWNDCLNLNCFSTEPNESFQTAGDVAGSKAESVMIAGLFLQAAREMSALYAFLGRGSDAARMDAARAEMLAAVEAEAWDGDWYRRAYDAEGRPVGSKECAEGRIFIESQAWCALGGAGADDAAGPSRGRARRALESVHRELYTPKGIVLQQPAYSTYHVELGEVSSYPPGVKENAGIFCHNNTWIHLALCELGEGDRALEYYRSICPSAKQAEIATYRSEPYVYAQMIAGRDAPCFGEAKNSWLTGTAAWALVALSQGILGIKPDYRGLRLDPCVARGWKGFSARRVFRGATYEIEVRNPSGISKGVKRLLVDGSEQSLSPGSPARAGGTGVLLPHFPSGSRHRVELELG
jgi:cellobiose phosphorylase